ncbi:pancreatic triacylglycerol lipase [Epargyreus clarus]|uniref:pancreatic triacylglycerol lipase n=1 Tax=Epargyreus clarus TaxID=520877 RepID=UPI003C2D1256
MLDSSACNLMSFYIGVVEVCFMSAPIGNCSNCCARDDVRDIQYKLFTRSHPNTFEILTQDLGALSRTDFDRNRPTVVYLIGFSEATTGPSTVTMRNAYLSTMDVNFIAVDWSRLIAFPWYISAVRNTRYMGERLAEFVQFLDSAGVRASTLHVIGFSLGAEAAGFAGKILRSRGLLLGRITGLDPAYPGYSLSNNDGHLAKGDASFVDVLHTNPGLFGFPQPIGDVDFYPNYGSWIQPGCWFDQLIRNREFEFVYGCSHNRAWRLYAESVINPSGFPATLCRDWKNNRGECTFQIDGYMGYGAQPPAAGKMFLDTNDRSPFARNGT